MRTCTKCGEVKPVSEFNKKTSNRDGLDRRCRQCGSLAHAAWLLVNKERASATTAAWHAAHPERVRAASAKWLLANPDRKKAASAKWREANPEKRRESCAKWRAANPERHIASAVRWQAANPERTKAIRAKYNEANREKNCERARAWLKANPEARRIIKNNRRAREISNGGKLSQGLAAKLFKLQRGKCACGCKQSLGDDYHLDHIIPLALDGANEDWNIQLLRAKCNLQKHAKHPIDFMQQRGFLL